MLNPTQQYLNDCRIENFTRDPAQEKAIAHTERLFSQLVQEYHHKSSLKNLCYGIWRKQSAPIKGIYLWGGVGRGKTYIVDSFYRCLPLIKIKNTFS